MGKYCQGNCKNLQMGKRKIKIAFIGIRGIPVVYSGFETLVEQLSVGLVKFGYDVVVYCRRKYSTGRKSYKGVKLVEVPSIEGKYFETLTHSYCATQNIISKKMADLVFVIGVGSSIFSLLLRIFGIKSVVHVDGLDWKREKWPPIGKMLLKLSERMAVRFPNRTLTDSDYVLSYYKEKYKEKIDLIKYGSGVTRARSRNVFKKFCVERSKYFMVSGRLVPDNHIEDAINAYTHSRWTYPLVIAGDSVNEDAYKHLLTKLAKGKNVIFTGFLDKPSYYSLLESCLLYIETKRSGGTHPSLVEASGLCKRIVAVENEVHRTVLGQGALFYRGGWKGLKKAIKKSLKLREMVADSFKKQRMDILRRDYNWKKVIVSYDKLVREII